jgi:hypothetical protein
MRIVKSEETKNLTIERKMMMMMMMRKVMMLKVKFI